MLAGFLKFVEAVINAVLPASIPRSQEPRMPETAEEAIRVFQTWDSRNGRYYLVADVAFADGGFERGVVFDGDTNIAVNIGGRYAPITDPRWLRRRIATLLVVDDCSAGTYYKRAGMQEREEFGRRFGARLDGEPPPQ